MQSLVELEVTTYSLIAQYANVYRRGCLDISDLDEDKYIIFEQLVTTKMSLMYSAFTQYKNGLMDEYNSYLLDWGRIYLKQPGFLGVWNKMKDNWPMDFCETLDDVEQATKHDA